MLCAYIGGHHQDTKVRVNIKVKDVNDNPPEFATNNEVLMCETVAPGKVWLTVCVKNICQQIANPETAFLYGCVVF